MPISQSEKHINGNTYCVQTFPARRGLKVKAKLAKLLAPFLAAMVNQNETVDSQWLNSVAKILVENLEENQWLDLIENLISDTRVDGIELRHQFDELFAGNYDTLYQVLRFILEVNFSDFLSTTLGVLTNSNQASTSTTSAP